MIQDNAAHCSLEPVKRPTTEPKTIDFQLLSPDQLLPQFVREITVFLDQQDNSHPFQFPQWAGGSGKFAPGSRFALLYVDGKLSWYASCGIFYPLGTRCSAIRALVARRGPVGDEMSSWPVGLRALAVAAKREGFTYVDVSPEIPDASAVQQVVAIQRWKTATEPRVSLRVNLRYDLASVYAGFRKTTRHEIQKSEKMGVRIEITLDATDITRFLEMYRSMALRKAFAPDSLTHVAHVIRWLMDDPQRGALLLARRSDELLGGVVVVRAGKRCWYVWGATDVQASGISVGHQLQAKAMAWAKEHGCVEYDLGGYREGATSGPALFKRGFGGELTRFLPSQRKVMHPVRYQLAQAALRTLKRHA